MKVTKQNPVIVEAIRSIMVDWERPIKHGYFNRRMFLEAVIVKGGEGAAIDKEDICRHGALTDKEFTTIKDEFVAKGVIKEETNLFGVTLYSLQYDSKEEGVDNLPEIK